MSWVGDAFGSTEAALEVLVAGTVCGVVGVHVVLRRISFLTMGLAHATFPGLVIAGLLGINLVVGGLAFAAAMAVGIALLGAADRVDHGVANGVLLSGGFAFGVVLASASQAYTRNITTYLVGSIATVSPTDVAVSAAAGAAVLAVLALLHKELVLGAFDPGALEALGYSKVLLDVVLVVAVAVTVVTALPAMGTVLAVALLVAPAATARLWTDRVGTAMATAAVLGAGSGLAGLAISVRFDTAAGATIALVAAAALAVSTVIAPHDGLLARRSTVAPWTSEAHRS